MKLFYTISIAFIALCFASCATSIEDNQVVDKQIVDNQVTEVTGFASVGWQNGATKVVTVTNAEDFKKYVSSGSYTVYVSGEIAITDKLPASSSDNTNEALNSFVAEKTEGKIKTWNDWKKQFALASTVTSNKKSNDEELNAYHSALVSAWQKEVVVNIASDTVIIGLDGAVIKGGSLKIKNVSNVAIKNLTIQDAFDPFPHHEANDGWNAEYDCISIESSHNIYIDHCTLQDTISVGEENFDHVREGDNSVEKWQTYDGLCDIKGSFYGVTVSNCHFKNHDKTMLVGSSDSEKFDGVRTLTLESNYFENCIQRLPMVRMTNVHAFNNYYNCTSLSSSYCIGVRYNCQIIAENNYFGEGIKYSFSGNSSKQGSVYMKGNIDKSSKGEKSGQFKTLTDLPFELSYSYSLLDVESLPSLIPQSAGASH